MHSTIRCYLLLCVIISVNGITAQNPVINGHGVPCVTKDGCGENNRCYNNFCLCSNHFCTLDEINSKSRSTIGRKNEICQSDADCKLENEICDVEKKLCVCKEGFITSNNGSKCLQVPDQKINGTCEDKNQCIAALDNTDCVNSVCECKKSYHFAVDRCYVDLKIGASCNLEQECANIIGAKCLDLTCKCPEGSFVNDDKCVSSIINNACKDNVTCTNDIDFSFCNNGTCTCVPMFFHYDKNNTCLKTEGDLGTPCIQKDHCYEEDPEKKINILQCSEESKICECISGYHAPENGTMGNSTCMPNSVGSREISVSILAILFTIHAFL